MGCVASKLEEEVVVSICRERKEQLKLAVDRRYALAEAHCRYCQSLYAVAAGIKLFVARHSSPTSPYRITFPPPCPSSSPPRPATEQNVITNPMFLQQRPSKAKTHEEAIANCESCDSSMVSSESCCSEEEDTKKEEVETREEQSFEYFYMQMPPAATMHHHHHHHQQQQQSPQSDFGWDFFNPFDTMRPEINMSGYRRSSDDDLRVVREEEGIPELEEEGEEQEQGYEQGQGQGQGQEEQEQGEAEKEVVVLEEKGREEVEGVLLADGVKVVDGEQKGLTVIDTPEKGRELLDALKDIEDHFIRAYDSGKDVSRMLEANQVFLQSGLTEIKENPTKLIQAIAWHRSASSKPSSCKSLVASTSKSSSTWTEFKNDLFEDYGGMDSGSHSLTLGRLYAWEKKLYEEVKAGDSTRKIYEKKCLRLRNHDVGGDELTVDKTRAAVKDLYARILVAIRSAESISKRIEKLRDEELQPQIVELLRGLSRTWKIMLESHETQNKILFEVKSFACPTYGKFCNDSHRLATLQLEAELRNWRACFTEYVTAQKAYVEALHGWLTKFLVPEVEFYSRGRRSEAPYRAAGPPLLMICHEWLSQIEKLPGKAVSLALKSFSKDVKALWAQQGEEQRQKRKVDSLAKDLDRRTLVAFQRVETRFIESKLIEYKPESDAEHQTDQIMEKKDQLDMLRRKLDMEREKHRNCMVETQRTTLNGFQTGFSSVFETLSEFSKDSMKMYNDLVNYSENAGKVENQTCLESSEVQENDTR